MTSSIIRKRYFDWICGNVWNRTPNDTLSYCKLFKTLNDVPYCPIKETDQSRYSDGIFLRNIFASEFNLSSAEVDASLFEVGKDRCSILEMMVALAIRMEDHIMSDDDYGNRTGQWFWEMVISLGLSGMDDSNFDCVKVRTALNNLNSGIYEKNGKGSLFVIDNPNIDMRMYDIWYQMQKYINEKHMHD